MSISSIQRRRLFEELTRVLYSSGEKPRLTDILIEMSRYFDKYQPGLPVKPIEGWAVSGRRSDLDLINEAFYALQHNMSVAYESSIEQARDMMALTTLLQNALEQMRSKRTAIIAEIDDYLFSLFNTDGYFMSLSDTFNNKILILIN